MKSLNGRSALITGSSSGIGLAVAKALAREGMNLVMVARNHEPLERAAFELRALGTTVIAVPADVTDLTHLQTLVDTAVGELGSIDVLVNNAGVESLRDFHQLSAEEVVQTVQVNLIAAMQLTRLTLPHMLKARCGHIVNMASTAGKYGLSFGAVYGASKAGQIAFTQSLRLEYFGEGISASVICPGCTTDGGMYQRMQSEVGFGPPWFLGRTTCDVVAQATVKAIRRDLPEVIVNTLPLRPLFILSQVSPRLANWLFRQGTRHFFRKIAKTREILECSALPPLQSIATSSPHSMYPVGKDLRRIEL